MGNTSTARTSGGNSKSPAPSYSKEDTLVDEWEENELVSREPFLPKYGNSVCPEAGGLEQAWYSASESKDSGAAGDTAAGAATTITPQKASVVRLFEIPRRDERGNYQPSLQPSPQHPPVTIVPPLLVELCVPTDSTFVNPNAVFISCMYPGAYKIANEQTSFGKMAAKFGIRQDAGIPELSREFRLDIPPQEERVKLTRLEIRKEDLVAAKANGDMFQSMWVLQIPGEFTREKLFETYAILKKFTVDVAFFKRSEIVIPLIGYSQHSFVTKLEVVHQAISWVYHCFRFGTQVKKITFITPYRYHLRQILNTFKEELSLLTDLSSPLEVREFKEDEARFKADIFLRPYVYELEQDLTSWYDSTTAIIENNEGHLKDEKDRKKLRTFKLLLQHVDLILDAFANKSDESQIVYVICFAGKQIAKCLLDISERMSEFEKQQSMDEKIQFVFAKLYEMNDIMMNETDFTELRVLLCYGETSRNNELSQVQNVVDAIFVMKAAVHLLFYFLPSVVVLPKGQNITRGASALPATTAIGPIHATTERTQPQSQVATIGSTDAAQQSNMNSSSRALLDNKIGAEIPASTAAATVAAATVANIDNKNIDQQMQPDTTVKTPKKDQKDKKNKKDKGKKDKKGKKDERDKKDKKDRKDKKDKKNKKKKNLDHTDGKGDQKDKSPKGDNGSAHGNQP